MASSLNLGDLPSWILVLLIGIGVKYANTEGILTGLDGLDNILIIVGLGLGAFYFATDISNKV